MEQPLSVEVWLAVGGFGYGLCPGMLKLGDGRLSFTALDNGTLWKRHRLALERATQRQGLAEQLDQGSVEVFDVPLSDVRELNVGRGIAFGTFKILVGNVRYLFHDVNPQGMHHNFIKLAGTLFKGISASIDVKAWRAELIKQMEALKSDEESRDATFSSADIVELAGMGKMFARFENWLFRKG